MNYRKIRCPVCSGCGLVKRKTLFNSVFSAGIKNKPLNNDTGFYEECSNCYGSGIIYLDENNKKTIQPYIQKLI